MYSMLPSWARKGSWIALGMIALGAWWAVEQAGLSWSAFRTVGAVVSVSGGLVWAVFGTSGYWSPWRILWRWIPALNTIIYPDLNGVWAGVTRSNWPVIKTLHDAAFRAGQISADELDAIELRRDGMAVLIRASIFRVQVIASLSNTGSASHSLTATASRDPHANEVRLDYVYQQETPEPVGTDESSHIGAGTLRFTFGEGASAKGEYWTRRQWRKGMNTAGLIILRRETERYLESERSLQSWAKAAVDIE